MPEHRLPPGRDLIDWLAVLGRALGYHPVLEWEVPDPAGPTKVDLGWCRRPDEGIPLFLFEVESRPGSQLAENAQKVLSMPTALMAKPLFFFQLVLRGGGGRAARAERSHATANYAIYSLSLAGEADRFVTDVIRHHGRVTSLLEPAQLMWALADPRALPVSASAAFDAAEQSAIEVPWARAYARLALEDRQFEQRLADRLERNINDDADEALDGIGLWNWWWGEPLRLGVLAALRPKIGPKCVQDLQHWQSNPHDPAGQTMIGPHFGLSRDYDYTVIFVAPYLLAVLAALTAHVPGAARWPAGILAELIDVEGLEITATAVASAWLLHIAWALDLPEYVERAGDHINAAGGLPVSVLMAPPSNGPDVDDRQGWQEWRETLTTQPVPFRRSDFQRRLESWCKPAMTAPLEIALQLLVHGQSVDHDGQLVRNWLHARGRALAPPR